MHRVLSLDVIQEHGFQHPIAIVEGLFNLFYQWHVTSRRIDSDYVCIVGFAEVETDQMILWFNE